MKPQTTDQANSSDINRQMLEIKKKIQLSEGRRKAAFEDCEAERKANDEEIHELKKEIQELVKELKEKTQAAAAIKELTKRLEALVGPCEGKKVDEITHLVDLHIIDKEKALDLVQYKIKKRQHLLSQLGKEYQTLLSQKSLKEVANKVDKPAKKATCELQNSIHAVEVQLREANHISLRYRDIKNSLQHDAAKFESNIKKIEDELEEQNQDIDDLQTVMNEATKKRGTARGHLLREEKAAMTQAHSRERLASEGKRLVTRRHQELEFLEKRIFQSGKTQQRPGSATGEDHTVPVTDDENVETPTPPEEQLTRAFETLKQATGAVDAEEVLHKFGAQKETLERLLALRETAEGEKRQLELKLEELEAQMEHYKFAEVKDSERKSNKMEVLQNQMREADLRSQKAQDVKSIKDKTLEAVSKAIRSLYLCINPLAIPSDDIVATLQQIQADLRLVLDKINQNQEEIDDEDVKIEAHEEKWLPAPYGGLVRRTPLPQPGTSPAPPPPPGSDEEEEVPSRSYLKRQAQLVVDAKLRRKNAKRN